MRELAILTADKTMNAVVTAFFQRNHWHTTLGCAAFDFWPEEDIINDPQHTDGGVHRRAHELVRPYLRTHSRVVVILDQQFGGDIPAVDVRDDILLNLRRNGWHDKNCEVVVIDPELEVWLWQDSPHVAEAVGYTGVSLRDHLATSGDWPEGDIKPGQPKEVIQGLMKVNRAGVPMVVYTKIARRVGVGGCQDGSFGQFRTKLQTWFPPERVQC